ncbi:MAG: hypothetical protein ACTSP4_00925 [Candidatus Hodarchaeales archaeon]
MNGTDNAVNFGNNPNFALQDFEIKGTYTVRKINASQGILGLQSQTSSAFDFSGIWFRINPDNTLYYFQYTSASSGALGQSTNVVELDDKLAYTLTKSGTSLILSVSLNGGEYEEWINDTLNSATIFYTPSDATPVSSLGGYGNNGTVSANAQIDLEYTIINDGDGNTIFEGYFEERNGLDIFDVTKINGNNGTIEGSMGSIRQEIDTIYSYVDQFGYSEGGIGSNIYDFNGFITDGWTPRSGGFIDNENTLSGIGAYKSPLGLLNNNSYRIQISSLDYTNLSEVLSTVSASYWEDGTVTSDFNNFTIKRVGVEADLGMVFNTTGSFVVSDIQIDRSYPSDVLIPASQSNLNQDVLGNTLDHKGKVAYHAKLVESNCVEYEVSNYTILDTIALNNASVWTVCFEKPASTAVAYAFIAGGLAQQNIGLTRSTSTKRPFFRSSDTLYHEWSGAGNTIAVDGTQAGIFKFTSDGTNIHLYIDGVSKGYITPTSTSIYVSQYGNGYGGALGYIGKLFKMAVWDTYNATDNEDTALFYHTLADGAGIHYDKSPNKNNGTPQGTLTNYYTTNDTARPNNLFDGFTQGLYCSSAGIVYKESTKTHGFWEYSINKGLAGNPTTNFAIISDSKEKGTYYTKSAYVIRWLADDRIVFTVTNSSGAISLQHLISDFNYLDAPNDIPRMLVIRLEEEGKVLELYPALIGKIPNDDTVYPADSFFIYAKGGSLGNDYALVPNTIGTNPFVDSTYTTSKFTTVQLSTLDSVYDIKVDNIPLELFDFQTESGTYSRTYSSIDPSGTGESLTNPGIGETGRGHNRAETAYLQPPSSNLYVVEQNFDYTIWFGVEHIVNGDFTFDSDWSKEAGWSISDGKAIFDGTTNSVVLLQPITGASSSGDTYIATFKIQDLTGGGTDPLIQFGASSQSITDDGNQTFTSVFSGNDNLFFRGYLNRSFAIEIISLKVVGDTTPVNCYWETISYDYELAGVWFADVTTLYPIKNKWAVVDTALVEPYLTDMYIFMNSVEKLLDSGGVQLLDSNDEEIYVLKAGVE